MWQIKQVDSEANVLELARSVNLNPALARILYLRDIKTKEQVNHFFNATLDDLHPINFLPDIEPAIKRIQQAIKNKEKIVIWGHEDLDGITSVMILYETIQAIQGLPLYHIPTKGKDKHGLSVEKAKEFAQEDVKLIITVDCGITNISEVKAIQDMGIDVIVTDHHEVLDTLPQAVANINPKRKDSQYPFSFLAGCGIALKLAIALVDLHLGITIKELFTLKPDFLSYLALGTISDRVPLIDENRILARFGIEQMAIVKNPAIRAILQITKTSGQKLTNDKFFSDIIPVFSSANGNTACDYFLNKDYDECLQWAGELLKQSQEWREEAKENLVLAETIADMTPGIIIVRDQRLSLKVLGHIAGKFKDRHQLPVLVLGLKGNEWIGECRGINGVDLIALLKAHSSFFSAYGGHKKACGFTVADNVVDNFIKSAKKYAKEHFAGNIIKENRIIPDAELAIQDLNQDFLKLLPFGESNPMPILISKHTALVKTNNRFTLFDQPDLEVRNSSDQIINGDKPIINMLYSFDENLVVTILKIENQT
jgi:single-stranded-DNA-specific exonuclease